MAWHQICPMGHRWPNPNVSRYRSVCPFRHSPYKRRGTSLQPATEQEQLSANIICNALSVRRVKILRARNGGGRYWNNQNRLATSHNIKTLYHELAHHVSYCRGHNRQRFHDKHFIRALKSVLRVAGMSVEGYKSGNYMYAIERRM